MYIYICELHRDSDVRLWRVTCTRDAVLGSRERRLSVDIDDICRPVLFDVLRRVSLRRH